MIIAFPKAYLFYPLLYNLLWTQQSVCFWWLKATSAVCLDPEANSWQQPESICNFLSIYYPFCGDCGQHNGTLLTARLQILCCVLCLSWLNYLEAIHRAQRLGGSKHLQGWAGLGCFRVVWMPIRCCVFTCPHQLVKYTRHVNICALNWNDIRVSLHSGSSVFLLFFFFNCLFTKPVKIWIMNLYLIFDFVD